MKIPTFAIVAQNRTPITIPQGGEVEVTDGVLDGNRLLDVLWESKEVMMFTIDIRERGERIDATGVGR